MYGVLRTTVSNIGSTLRYLISPRRRPGHEGRYLEGVWRNWNRTLEVRPRNYERPSDEETLRRVVARAEKLRVVGSGHSFNAAVQTEGTLLSLDAYDALLELDRESGRVRVQAGMRVRDLVRQLADADLALPMGGSTDAQSIGGLVATDVHGTGRKHAYLSPGILSLRVVDAAGEIHDLQPGGDAFNAVVGGIGTCGVVTEVELQCVPGFRLEKKVKVVDAREIDAAFAGWQREYDHLSFYFVGGVRGDDVRLNAWRRTNRGPSRLTNLRETTAELVDMGFSGFILRAAAAVGLGTPITKLGFRGFAAFQNDSVVYPSAQGYARRLFYRHDEIEHGVAMDRWQACLSELMEMLRDHPPTIVEVRFAPDMTPSLLGPGAGRATCFLELAPSLTSDPTAMFCKAEAILLRYGGQPHLGKWVSVDAAGMRAIHGERFDRFDAVRRTMDPDGKFVSDLVSRLLLLE